MGVRGAHQRQSQLRELVQARRIGRQPPGDLQGVEAGVRREEAQLGEDAEGLSVDVCRDRQPASAVDEFHRLVQFEGGGPGQRRGLRARLAAVGRQHRLLAEERVVAGVGFREESRTCAATRSASAGVGEEPHHVDLLHAGQLHAGDARPGPPASPASCTARHVAGGVVVADGDHVKPLAKAVATMAAGVISSAPQGDRAVWMCRSARNDRIDVISLFNHGPLRHAPDPGR